MSRTDQLKNLQNDFNEFSNEFVRVKHEHELLTDAHKKTVQLIEKYETDKENYTKAVELLSVVQAVTRDKIKAGFEDIVSWSLKYIYQDEYKFSLAFGRRGNLSELDFAIRTPDHDEDADPMDTRGGGILNVVSLILRLVLMEVSVPKINGFIILDESFKNVNGQDNIDRLNGFVKEVNTKFNRQIIHITDMDNFKNNSEDNLIEIK